MSNTQQEGQYVPYGPEWEKELMKHSKKSLIDLYRRQLTSPLSVVELKQTERKKSPYQDVNGVDIYEGDVVKGIGEHVGQSEVFFGYNQWQPFSYLNDYDGKNYQIVAPLKLLQQKFAQHLGVPDLDTSDAYAVEWAVKNYLL